jgi:putative ABC transport system permease protein
MTHLMRDLKQGIRLLLRKPGFTIVALVTLALGIGANSAIFTVAHALLLKPLPYSNPDELVIVNENNLSRGWASFSVSAPNFVDWRAQTSSFATLAAYGGRPFNYSSSGTPERLRALSGTQGFLEMLDGTPEQGRGFHAEEFEPGQSNVVILGHGFWERSFAGQDVRNQTIVLNGQPFTIVGVMHPDWRFGGRDIAIFTPRTLGPNDLGSRGGHSLSVIGRLKPGVSQAAAQAELSSLATRLEQQYPDTNKGWGVVTTSLFDAAVGNVRPMIAILLGAVGVVLLVACANLANMHLARATGRAREMAIRAAIGAGRWRIAQQLLTESAVLAAVGGTLGLLLAYWATTSFIAAYPTLLPRTAEIHVDVTVLAFTAALSIVTAALFGLAPAIAAARVRFNDTLKDGARGAGGRLRRILRSALVVSEVALALILLAGAGLLLKSFIQLAQVDPGFQTDHRLTATTFLPRPKYAENPRVVDFFDRAMEEVRAIPAVEQVALASLVPISGNDEIYSITFEERPPLPPGQGVSAIYYLVSPEYFQTMGISLLQGRVFTDQDRDGTPRVAVINDAFARLHYPNENPIGQRIRMGRNSSIVREIVGVVSSVKHYGLTDKSAGQMYEPFRQMPYPGMTFVIQTRDEPLGAVPAVKQALQRVDPDQPVAATASIEQMVSDAGALPRVQTILMGALGAITLLLAAVGLYGVMAYSVSQRTQEIGIRMTLGASRPAVLLMVLRQAAGLAAIGLAIGVTGAIIMGRLLTSVLEPMLFQVTPVDAATLTGVSVLLAIVAIAAALIPARRATRVDPIQALRSL